jgi:hypothetical protein
VARRVDQRPEGHGLRRAFPASSGNVCPQPPAPAESPLRLERVQIPEDGRSQCRRSRWGDDGVGLEQLAQAVAGLVEQRWRVRPLFEDDRAGKLATLKPFHETANAGVVASGRAGEKRQVRIGVAPVFVEVEVDDGNPWVEPVQKREIIVVGRGGQVGVAEVEAHADAVGREQAQRPQAVEQLVEIFRRVMRSILYGKLQAGFGHALDERRDRSRIRVQARLMVEMDIQQGGADCSGQIEVLQQQRTALWLQGVSLPARMDR